MSNRIIRLTAGQMFSCRRKFAVNTGQQSSEWSWSADWIHMNSMFAFLSATLFPLLTRYSLRHNLVFSIGNCQIEKCKNYKHRVIRRERNQYYYAQVICSMYRISSNRPPPHCIISPCRRTNKRKNNLPLRVLLEEIRYTCSTMCVFWLTGNSMAILMRADWRSSLDTHFMIAL